MTARKAEALPKAEWGPGPWQEEPDRLEWTTAAGLPGLIVRDVEVTGALCGYVGVPPGHPLYGIRYNGCVNHHPPIAPEELLFPRWDCACPSPEGILSVHGGLTYSRACDGGAICHTPAPGAPDHVWWFGFDCAHAGDHRPGIEATLTRIYAERGETRERSLYSGESYKDLAFVQAEVEQLAVQLADYKGEIVDGKEKGIPDQG